MTEEMKCLICLETLRRPVRMLACGHNFCHVCLVGLCAAYEDKKCPACRKKIELGSAGVQCIPRNHTLENLIESIEKMKFKRSKSPKQLVNLTGNAIKQLKELGDVYQQQHNYKRAVETLQVVSSQAKGWEKLESCVVLAACYLDMGNFCEARKVRNRIISFFDAKGCPPPTDPLDVYDDKIKHLAVKFLEAKDFESAISLTGCRFEVIKTFRCGEAKLVKLEDVGWLMTQICKEVSEKNHSKCFKKKNCLMDEILEFMQNQVNVNVQTKCRQVAWFLGRYAFCCIQMKDWKKSIRLNGQAIALVKTAFGAEASKFRIFGSCHYNLGVALQNTDELHEARAVFVKSHEIYEQACDWMSEERKLSSIESSTRGIERIDEKITKSQT